MSGLSDELSQSEQECILSGLLSSEDLDLYVEAERKVQQIEPEWLRSVIMKDLASSPVWLVAEMQSESLCFEDDDGNLRYGTSPYSDYSATMMDHMLLRAENAILKKSLLNM